MPPITNWPLHNEAPQTQNEIKSHKKMTSMKTNEPTNKREESTYSLLVRSDQKKPAFLEAVVYGLVILSALAAILEFANEFIWFPA
jgi:hypothetical protein